MPISLLFDLANYTPADASPLQSNLQQIEQYLNQEVITRDGLVAMTAALRLANSTPVNPLDAASKGYVDSVWPIGALLMVGHTGAASTGWLVCDGSLVSRATYAALYAAIGTQYGAGDGVTTFKLPDLRGKIVVPQLTGQAEVDTVGETGGEYTHILATSEMPIHAHGGGTAVGSTDHVHSMDHQHAAASVFRNGTDPTGVGTEAGGGNARMNTGFDFTGGVPFQARIANYLGTTGGISQNHAHQIFSDGGGQAHQNMPPYQVIGRCWIRSGV